MADFQPPPTYAEVVLVDEQTKRATFNPIWLKWFIDLVGNLGPSGAGSVSSVGLSLPSSLFTVTSSPVTSSGTLTGTLKTQVTKTFLAGPTSGADAVPTFRVLATADLPAGTGTVTSVASNFTGGLISVAGSPITTSGTLAFTVAGTSGGIPYFSGATTWASSGALGTGQVVYGGGAGVAPASSANLKWDNTNKRFSIGTASANAFSLDTGDTTPIHISTASVGGGTVELVLGGVLAKWRATGVSNSFQIRNESAGTTGSNIALMSNGDITVSQDTFASLTRFLVNNTGTGFRCGDSTDTNYLDFISGGVTSSFTASGNRPLKVNLNGQNIATFLSNAGFVIGAGTTSQTIGNANNLQVQGTSAATNSAGISAWSADALGARIEGGKSRGAAIGTNTIVQNGDVVFTTTGYGATGSGFQECASWEMGIDGTPGASNDMPGFHKFYTTPDGSGTRTLALKIGQDQKATFSSTITVVGGASFITTSTALTNGAGVGLGTLTNAPAAGDPTKWVGINDNGTTRYIPAW